MTSLALPPGLVGAGVGLAFGLGLLLVLLRGPAARRPRLEDRLAPYLRDVAPPSALLRVTHVPGPFATLERLLAPVMADAVRWVERVSGGPGTVHRRLDQAGRGLGVEQFRAEQVVWGVLGALAGLGLGLALAAARGLSVVPVVGLVLVGTLLGVLARDWQLSRQVRRR